MGKEDILKLLYEKEGEYVSGESMSQQLGVSRSAVWKQISNLRKKGYEIDSITQKGYCLKQSPFGLEKEKLAKLLGNSLLGQQLICYNSIDSTNTEVKRLANEGAAEGLVVTAEQQTAGRGRRGRSFHSPSHQGLYFSILLRPPCSSQEISNLTAWVAVAVCRGISRLTSLELGIKWTNDIVWNKKKISGILTELTLESGSDFVEYVVVGVGVNVSQEKEDFPTELQDIASSLQQALGKSLDRNQLCASILLELNAMYSQFPDNKQDYLEEYRKYCISLNQPIQVLKGELRRGGTALEIDEEFRLLVEYDNGEKEALSTGEVSVRGLYGYV